MDSTRLLQAGDLVAYRQLRLRALQDHPEIFGPAPEEFTGLSNDDVLRELTADLPDNGTIGAFEDGMLVGIVAINRHFRHKARHRVNVSGMYIAPEVRGRGLGRTLLEAALRHIHGLGDVEQVTLSVTSGNNAARRLYRSFGFITWGVDPAYIRVGDTYYDMEKMILFL